MRTNLIHLPSPPTQSSRPLFRIQAGSPRNQKYHSQNLNRVKRVHVEAFNEKQPSYPYQPLAIWISDLAMSLPRQPLLDARALMLCLSRKCCFSRRTNICLCLLAFEVSDAIAVRVFKGARVDLIKLFGGKKRKSNNLKSSFVCYLSLQLSIATSLSHQAPL